MRPPPHVAVTPCITTMGETHPATLARPEIAAPIRDLVAMFIAEIANEHFLNPRGKGIDTNLADVNSNIVIVIVCGNVWKELDVQEQFLPCPPAGMWYIEIEILNLTCFMRKTNVGGDIECVVRKNYPALEVFAHHSLHWKLSLLKSSSC
jgi:hypothetical protein